MAKPKSTMPEVLEKLVENVTTKGGDVLSDLSKWGLDDAAEEIKDYIKKNPLKSLGIAVGIGFVLSSLLRSSREGDK